MTSYFAYDHDLPCKNPSCKSHGRPHPNCRCYGDMAEGGEVGFCAKDRAHQAECEYFADGGDSLPPGAIPAEEFEAAEPSPPEGLPEGAIPSGQFEATQDETPPPGAIPEDQFVSHDDRYKTPGQRLATAGEGLAEGFAGPAATATEIAYGNADEGERGAIKKGANRLLPGGVGFALGAALDALTSQGLTKEDIAGRADSNPLDHIGGELSGLVLGNLTGVGEAGAIAKGLEKAVPKLEFLGQYAAKGQGAVKMMLANGLIHGGDEVSNWMLGLGNQEDAVASAFMRTGVASLFGLIPGYFSGKYTSQVAEKAEAGLGNKISSYLAGFGEAASEDNPEQSLALAVEGLPKKLFDPASAEAGRKAFAKMTAKIVNWLPFAGTSTGAIQGYNKNGLKGAVTYGIAGALVGEVSKIAGKRASESFAKVAAPVVTKIMSSGNSRGIFEALNHGENVERGAQILNRGIEGLFSTAAISGQQTVNAAKDELTKRKLDELLSNGGGMCQDIQNEIFQQNDQETPSNFAEGGIAEGKPKVSPIHDGTTGVAMHYPEQNLVMNAAKGRVSEYLNSLRPQEHQPKLAFDDAPDTREQKKSYDKALGIAVRPMRILDEVKQGTLDPEHVKHLKAMFPEVDSLLQKKLTEKITTSQIEGKKPSYKVRQGLSLLLGTALSGEMKPENIQAAQAVFLQQAKPEADAGPEKGTKKSSQSLSKSEQSYLTGSQALVKRSQKI